MHRTSVGLTVGGLATLSALLGGCVFGGGDDPTEVVPTATSTQDAVATNTPAATETVAGATTTTTSPTPSENTHTVEAGQSLGVIAALYGVTVQAIVEANGISDPNLIFTGQVLVIPGGSQ